MLVCVCHMPFTCLQRCRNGFKTKSVLHPDIALIMFSENWMGEVKSGTYKIGSFHQSLSLPVQLEHMLQYRAHRISYKGCFTIDNDGSATPAFSLLVKP